MQDYQKSFDTAILAVDSSKSTLMAGSEDGSLHSIELKSEVSW